MNFAPEKNQNNTEQSKEKLCGELIILGNGFDLSVGLESTYNDFFKWYYKDIIGQKNQYKPTDDANVIIEQLLEQQTNEIENFWFFIFFEINNKEKNFFWTDIENIISVVLMEIDEKYYEYYKNRFSGSGLLSEDVIQKAIEMKLSKLESPITVKEFYDDLKKGLSYGGTGKDGKVTFSPIQEIPYLPEYSDPDEYYIQIEKEEFVKELYKDLNKVEEKFTEFLNQKLQDNNKYYNKANQLIAELIVYENIQRPNLLYQQNDYYIERNKLIKNKENSTQILSFNYTYPLEREGIVEPKLFTNVHGRLNNNNIVFGIDGHNLEMRQVALPFTKTYRIMENNQPVFNINQELETIKVFGHGLAEADYSYFQTVFDSVNLYTSSCKIIFYYTVYDMDKELEIKETHKQAIHKLIKRYGETLDNKDHGKNLLHKLLIEGRLLIKEINVGFLQKRSDW